MAFWILDGGSRDRRMKDIGLWARANAIDALQAAAMAVLTR
jgi:hypothetical protein